MSDEEDPRVAAARYRAEKARNDAGEAAPDPDAVTRRTGTPTPSDRTAYIETAIQQAIRAGAFDDLPGAGKPIPDLGRSHDPDWWIRRKIQTEQLTGLGPPAIMLRVEHAEFADRADALAREADVRVYVEDFNRRVIEARRQLLGGPPVVTPTLDVEAEVAAWHARRAARAAEAAASAPPPAPERRRFRRRRGEAAQ